MQVTAGYDILLRRRRAVTRWNMARRGSAAHSRTASGERAREMICYIISKSSRMAGSCRVSVGRGNGGVSGNRLRGVRNARLNRTMRCARRRVADTPVRCVLPASVSVEAARPKQPCADRCSGRGPPLLSREPARFRVARRCDVLQRWPSPCIARVLMRINVVRFRNRILDRSLRAGATHDQTMKAAVVHAFGEPLRIEARADAGARQILVNIKASGVCHTDLRSRWRLAGQADVAVHSRA